MPVLQMMLRCFVLLSANCAAFAASNAPPDDLPQKDTPEAAILRGEIVFRNYCVLCHGMNADGQGRAARMYNPKPANLRTSTKPDSYKTLIIRKGGLAVARSEFMPPWGEELTDEQIADVVRYLGAIAPPRVPR